MEMTLNSCWNEPEEVESIKSEFKSKYSVDAEFYDGGDHYSSWTLKGTKENVEKCAKENWGEDWQDNVE